MTDLVTQNGFGNLTATMQVHGVGTSVTNDNITDSYLNNDYCILNPPPVSKPSEQRSPTYVHFDPLTATAYFNDTSTVGGGYSY